MKRYSISILLFFISFLASAQADTTNPTIRVAYKISARMQDSLALSGLQRDQIHNITIQIQNQKSALWHQYIMPDSLRFHVQQVENRRDSLYKGFLSPVQYGLYMDKRASLLSNQ